jgi:phage-related protein
MPWTVIYHQAAAEELADQPEDIRAKLDYIVQLIVKFGLERIPGKYARHLQGRLWEFRLKGKDGIARALYVTAHGQRILVVRIFTKKTQKTPRREIDLAFARAKEMP